MATAKKSNVADGNLVKYRVELIWRRYTSGISLWFSIGFLCVKNEFFFKIDRLNGRTQYLILCFYFGKIYLF